MAIFNWVKTHKLIIFLLLIIAYLVAGRGIVPVWRQTNYGYGGALPQTSGLEAISPPSFSLKTASQDREASGRMVIQNSNLSLLVKDVRQTADKIIDWAKRAGGYMVSVSYNRPIESPFATITVRVPTDRLDEALGVFRSLSVKVTSENLVGTDVTEEYSDLGARLAMLEKTKAKFEEILNRASTVSEILEVQRELISLGQQIDSVVGQQKALSQNARLTKVTVYLSTDELALPYAPDKAFRPEVVFKQAVRSLLNTLRTGAEALIWIGVFAVIWVPATVAYVVFRRRREGKHSVSNQVK